MARLNIVKTIQPHPIDVENKSPFDLIIYMPNNFGVIFVGTGEKFYKILAWKAKWRILTKNESIINDQAT